MLQTDCSELFLVILDLFEKRLKYLFTNLDIIDSFLLYVTRQEVLPHRFIFFLTDLCYQCRLFYLFDLQHIVCVVFQYCSIPVPVLQIVFYI